MVIAHLRMIAIYLGWELNNPLVAFYEINGRNREVKYFVQSRNNNQIIRHATIYLTYDSRTVKFYSNVESMLSR
jgi:hypothetical protein